MEGTPIFGDEPKGLVLSEVRKRLGSNFEIADISIFVEPGEFLCILGPSGSGKSTLLGLVGGWVTPDSGEILIGDERVQDWPIFERPVRTCFQKGGFLFPHMNVARNIGYALEVKGLPKREIKERVNLLLTELDLEGFEFRHPQDLSGGEAQRVAIARALADPQPVLLLDEIETGLDRRLRRTIREILVKLAKSHLVTVLYVTHDSAEALALSSSLGSRIAAVREGRIDQIGKPEEIYRHPRSSFTALLTGDANVFRVALSRDSELLTEGGCRWNTEFEPVPNPRFVVIRPESVRLSRKSALKEPNAMKARVASVEYLGSYFRVAMKVGEETVEARVNGEAPEVGQDVSLSVDAADVIPLSE